MRPNVFDGASACLYILPLIGPQAGQVGFVCSISFHVPLCVGEVFLIGLLYLLPFIGLFSEGSGCSGRTKRALWRAAAGSETTRRVGCE